MWYVTMHIQKDGRINLGTKVHSSYICPAIIHRDSSTIHQIDGDIVKHLSVCDKCKYHVSNQVKL